MTLKEKILQTFIVTVREINKHGGPKEFFEKYPVGGMYYSVLPGAEDIKDCASAENILKFRFWYVPTEQGLQALSTPAVRALLFLPKI